MRDKLLLLIVGFIIYVMQNEKNVFSILFLVYFFLGLVIVMRYDYYKRYLNVIQLYIFLWRFLYVYIKFLVVIGIYLKRNIKVIKVGYIVKIRILLLIDRGN